MILKDDQTFDLVISIDKNKAFAQKINKYKDATFSKHVIPIAIDYNMEMHPISYQSITKYMNGNVLK